jgi:hypothetical protein
MHISGIWWEFSDDFGIEICILIDYLLYIGVKKLTLIWIEYTVFQQLRTLFSNMLTSINAEKKSPDLKKQEIQIV